MAPKLLVVLSEQRSGSTFLSEAVARVLPCAVALGEPLLRQVNAGGYLQWPFAGVLDAGLRNRRLSNPLAWLRHVRKHACASLQCECVGVVKLFRHHEVDPYGLRRLVSAPDVMSVVLERDASEVECSLRWAERTSDWSNTPQGRGASGRLEGYRDFKATFVPTAAFAALHNKWYAQLRHLDYTTSIGFSELIRHTPQALQRVARALNATVANWTLPLLPHNAPVVRPTLAMIVIVRRYPERLEPWLAHHTRSGVDEVVIYSTPETRVEVERIADVAVFTTKTHSHWLRGTNSSWTRTHWPLAEAIASGGGALWSYSWKTCQQCCSKPMPRALVRAAPIEGMCARRMYMPEQAHVVRHALLRLVSTWVLHIDLDEYLAADGSAPDAWRTYLATLDARERRPGGVRLNQLQMVHAELNKTAYLVAQPHKWAENKALVRRDAFHLDPRAYGSVHEVTLRRDEFYVRAPNRVLDLLHYRYMGWHTDRRAQISMRLAELGCAAKHNKTELALICRSKRTELVRWDAQLRSRPRAQLDVGRLPME